mmetsp:Transcript_33968/g.44829  ORF Transcript_33968/g.44829 Transcript_33968/m.44829 type:complete len:582 (-) Transcript_33968:166-1911(-)
MADKKENETIAKENGAENAEAEATEATIGSEAGEDAPAAAANEEEATTEGEKNSEDTPVEPESKDGAPTSEDDKDDIPAVDEEVKPDDETVDVRKASTSNAEDVEELEVTAEGLASSGQGIKKIFFVKQKGKETPVEKKKGLLYSFSEKMEKFAGSMKKPTFDSVRKPNFSIPVYRSSSQQTLPTKVYDVGDLVTANFMGMGHRPGEILQVNEDGSFDVLYAHGAKEVRISPAHIKKKEEKTTDDTASEVSSQFFPTSWVDLPPTDPREFEIFWDPAQGPLFFTLGKYIDGAVIATKVDLGNEAVQNTRLNDGSVLTTFTDPEGTHSSSFTFDEVVDQVKTAKAPIGFRFREGPPIYRDECIAEAKNSLVHPHFATFLPHPQVRDQAQTKTQGSPFSFNLSFVEKSPSQYDYEDLFKVSQRAMEFLTSFHDHGVPTKLMNLETLLIPEQQLQETPVTSGSFTNSDRLVQAVRVWWTFPNGKTVKIERSDEEVKNKVPFGLIPVKDGEDGGFIIVRAIKDSACARSGIPVDKNLILTHINGYDVCPQDYRSVALKRDVPNTWTEAVIPLFLACDTSCTISYV